MLSLFDPLPDDAGDSIFPEAETARLRMMLSLRRSRQFLVTIPVVVALLILVALQDERTFLVMGIPHVAWRIALVALLVGFIVFTGWNYRCPGCDGFLDRRYLRPDCEICRGYP